MLMAKSRDYPVTAGGASWSRRTVPVHATLVSIIFVLFFSSSYVFSSAETAGELVCLTGVSGFAGATFPRGDIKLRKGDTLEVYCTLNMTHPSGKGYNSSNIHFTFKKHDIPNEMIKTTIINETTAVVRVENMNVSMLKLDCEILTPVGQPIPICENHVEVGYPPLPVDNFRCVAKDWRSIKCTWKKPYNPIRTTYELTHWARRGYNYECPTDTKTETSCEWGPRTNPHYKPNDSTYHLRLNGSNTLKPEGVLWDYNINHFSIVVPEKAKVIAEPLSPNKILVNWTFPNFEHFEPGLFHRVSVCSQEDNWCNTTVFMSKMKEYSKLHEIEVPYAFTNYTIEIYMRSQTANDTEEFWSPPAKVVVATWAKSPDFPPKTDVGSFESISTGNNDRREVYIYWEHIPRTHHNGPKFEAKITVFEEDELRDDILPEELEQSYAKFVNIGLLKSYRFEIQSVNANGTSPNKSIIFVPGKRTAPGEPKTVSKLDFTNGTFEVSWKPPTDASSIVSYTVFRCMSRKPRPYQCEGKLEWDNVTVSENGNRKVFQYLPLHNEKIYQFAVSANSYNMSSGMIWASCTLIHDKVPEKLKVVKNISAQEKAITIEWQLDCSYQPGVVNGFQITYCIVSSPSAKSCSNDNGNNSYKAEVEADKTTYHLKDLNPYSTYMIAVSVQTPAGESQKSDPLFATTLEGAPSSPSYVQIVNVTNTSAIIHIGRPQIINGILRKYSITYKPLHTRSSDFKSTQVDVNSTLAKDEEITVATLTDLISNSQYSISVAACTVKCSSDANHTSFNTTFGYTNFTTAPTLLNQGGAMMLKWSPPSHLGGPIKHFEVLLKQNGKEILQDEPILFSKDLKDYEKDLRLNCESDTNLTAQVRAVTVLRNGQQLIGSWSPEAAYGCGGGAAWFMWLLVVIGALVIIALISLGSIKWYNYIKDASKIPIKLPPGIGKELNGFTRNQVNKHSRKNSGGDTQPYGKENLTYQLQMRSNHSEESKDFLSNDSNHKEKVETEVDLGLGDAGDIRGRAANVEDGTPCDVDVDHSQNLQNGSICLWQVSSNDSEPPSTLQTSDQVPKLTVVPMLNFERPSHAEDCLMEKSFSPSPSNPLLSGMDSSGGGDGSGTDDEDQQNQNYQMRPLPNGSATVVENDTEIRRSLIAPSSLAISMPPQESLSSPTTSEDEPPDSPDEQKTVPGVLPSNNTTSYVRWTQMVPDDLTGGGEVGLGSSPYCQVGILLDS